MLKSLVSKSITETNMIYINDSEQNQQKALI